MFCTTLRRRPSYASALPSLMSAGGLQLRENKLDTHDLAIPLGKSSHAGMNSSEASRQLRFLLLAPSCMSDPKLPETLDRIHRFTSLTGGQDLAIIFLLNPPKTSSFVSAKSLDKTTSDLEACTRSVFAYTQLQASLLERDDIPHVPILPLASSEDLPGLLTRQVADLSNEHRSAPVTASSFGMLQLSTAETPMDRQTAYFVTDCFADLRELATACTQPATEPTSSSPSQDVMDGSLTSSSGANFLGHTKSVFQTSGAGEGLRQLLNLVEGQKYQEIIDFWLDEWVVE